MLKDIAQQLLTGIFVLIFFTVLTGLIYPSFITLILQFFFPWQANGSLIEHNGKIVGSELIGQSFTTGRYFWSRPSATTPFPYNGENSSGSNAGPLNPTYLTTVQNRVTALQQIDPQNIQHIPVDLVTASASGLDPDISLYAAYYQVPRVAKVRHMQEQDITQLINTLAQKRTLTILGENRVNVLKLNIALDDLEAIRNNHGRTSPQP